MVVVEKWKKDEKRGKRKREKERINLTIGKRQNIRTAVVQHGYRYILIKRETCGEKWEKKEEKKKDEWKSRTTKKEIEIKKKKSIS